MKGGTGSVTFRDIWEENCWVLGVSSEVGGLGLNSLGLALTRFYQDVMMEAFGATSPRLNNQKGDHFHEHSTCIKSCHDAEDSPFWWIKELIEDAFLGLDQAKLVLDKLRSFCRLKVWMKP